MRQVMIHSDGSARGTVVVDEDGKTIANIVDLSLSISPTTGAIAVLEISAAKANIKASVETVVFTCALCSSMVEHHCDETLGNFHHHDPCGDGLTLIDPHSQHDCVMPRGHTGWHFDGDQKMWPQ